MSPTHKRRKDRLVANPSRVSLDTLIDLLVEDPEDEDVQEMVAKKLADMSPKERKAALLAIGEITYQHGDYFITYYPEKELARLISPRHKLMIEVYELEDDPGSFMIDMKSKLDHTQDIRFATQAYLFLTVVAPEFPFELIGLFIEKNELSIDLLNEQVLFLFFELAEKGVFPENSIEAALIHAHLGFLLANNLRGHVDEDASFILLLDIAEKKLGPRLFSAVLKEQEERAEDLYRESCLECGSDIWSALPMYHSTCPECEKEFRDENFMFFQDLMKAKGYPDLGDTALLDKLSNMIDEIENPVLRNMLGRFYSVEDIPSFFIVLSRAISNERYGDTEVMHVHMVMEELVNKLL